MEQPMLSNDAPLVSVLVPVYNCETYLRECLESVLRQTYRNWECIVVNNCSTDKTLAIAQEFADRDSRVRVHNNTEFVRVIRNHNNAFEQTSPRSKYIKLVQADDWIYPECIEKMVALAEANPGVGLVGAYGLLGDSRVAWFGLPYRLGVVSGRDIGRRWLLDGEYILGSPTATMIRADIARKKTPFWDEGSIHADTESYIEFLKECEFGFVHQVLSFTRVREGMTSLANRINSYLPSVLGCLVRDGAYYLSKDELDLRLKRHLHNYYAFLAKSLLKLQGRDFWRFHRNKMAEFGHPLRVGRLALAVVSLVLDKLLNPKRTAEGVIRTIEMSRSAAPPLDTP
jgi:glycosyltransferase involved in cell wall biosynthesis